jgi:hypothetical protein
MHKRRYRKSSSTLTDSVMHGPNSTHNLSKAFTYSPKPNQQVKVIASLAFCRDSLQQGTKHFDVPHLALSQNKEHHAQCKTHDYCTQDTFLINISRWTDFHVFVPNNHRSHNNDIHPSPPTSCACRTPTPIPRPPHRPTTRMAPKHHPPQHSPDLAPRALPKFVSTHPQTSRTRRATRLGRTLAYRRLGSPYTA